LKIVSAATGFLMRIFDSVINVYLRLEEKVPENIPIRKITIIGGSVILLTIGFFVARGIFGKDAKESKEAPVAQVKVKKAKKEMLSDKYSVLGTIRGTIENDLKFEIEGTIARYNFAEGARVRKGEIICSLDPKDAISRSAYARSKFNAERSSYYSSAQRMKVYGDLYKMKAISETKYNEARYETDAAKERMDAASSELELAQSNMEKTNLSAPGTGVLAERIIQSGEFVTPHDVVAKFISGGDINFEVDVPEKDVEKIKVGMKVKVLCDAYKDVEFSGKVKEVAPTVKEKTRTTVVKIEIPNDEGKLRSGMFARGDIIFTEIEDAIAVPQDTVIALGAETKLVPLLKPDPTSPNHGIIELRQVTVGPTIGKQVVVLDGINPDEMIVVETQAQLSDGLQVQFQEVLDDMPKM